MRKRIREIQSLTQHHFNVVHLYCRLVDAGMKKHTVAVVCRFLERTYLYKILYI
jgi:hypothetical protein